MKKRKIKHSGLLKAASKIPAKGWLILLAAIVLLGAVSATLAVTFASTGDFTLRLNWNGEPSYITHDGKLYTYDSDTPNETRALRMNIAYSADNLSQAFPAGGVQIAVQGLKEIYRKSDGLAAAVGADKAEAPLGEQNSDWSWSYSYTPSTDTYTFFNKNPLEAGDSFTGSFELIWEVPSRDSKDLHGSEISRTAFLTAGLEQQTSNAVNYTASRAGDEFTVAITSKATASAEGLQALLPSGTVDQYTFGSYTIQGSMTEKARAINGKQRVVLWIPQYATLLSGGFTKTGAIFSAPYLYEWEWRAAWECEIDITPETPETYWDNLVVAYPQSYYYSYDFPVTVTLDTNGTYFDNTASEQLAVANDDSYAPNFFFTSPAQSYSFGAHGVGMHSEWIDRHDTQCKEIGAILAGDMNGAAAMDFNFEYDPSITAFYDAAFVVDELYAGEAPLADGQYQLTYVEIPANTGILNRNGLPIAPYTYPIALWARVAGETDYVQVDTTGAAIGTEPQTLGLPKGTAAVKVVVKGLAESITNSVMATVGYHYNGSSAGSLTAMAYVQIFDDQDVMQADTSEAKSQAALHVLHIGGEYSVAAELLRGKDRFNSFGVVGNVTVQLNKVAPYANVISNADVYALLPEGATLPPYVQTGEDLLPDLILDPSQIGISSVDITENYRDSNRTLLKINVAVDGANQFRIGIPFLYPRGTEDMDISLEVMAVMEGNYAWYPVSDETPGAVWSGVKGAFATGTGTIYNPVSINAGFGMSVMAGFSKSYVAPVKNETGEYDTDLPYVNAVPAEPSSLNKGNTYTYRLALQTGDYTAANLVFADVLETAPKAEWQGKFLSVDTSQAELFLGTPTIYYSASEETLGETAPDFTSGGWTTTQPATVRSVAVDFGSAQLPAGTQLHVDIMMQAPPESPELEAILASDPLYLTENSGGVYYNVNGGSMVHLQSNLVPVQLGMEGIDLSFIIRGGDFEANEAVAPLPGVEFSLYHAPDELYRANLVTDANGIVRLRGVPAGDYNLVFQTVPAGYQLIADRSLSLPDPGEEITIPVTLPRKPSEFTVAAVSAANETFAVPGVTVKAEGTGITATTSANGEITIANSSLPWGDYNLIITGVPEGFEMTGTKFPFTINAENDAGRLLKLTIPVPQQPAQATLHVKDDLSDAPVIGAVYGLYLTGGDADKRVGLYVTDAAGNFTAENLAFGSYYFQQYAKAVGYGIATAQLPFALSPANASQLLETANEQLPGIISILKLDADGQPVPGAAFSLFAEFDESFNDALQTLTTGPDGKLSFEPVPWGNYVVRETAPAPGHDPDLAPYAAALRRENAETGLLIVADGTMGRGAVQLIKVSAANTALTLSGAEFTLYKGDGSIYRSGLATDSEGKLLAPAIPWGNYYFQETLAPSSYGLNPNKIPFTVNIFTANATQTIIVQDPQPNASNRTNITITQKLKVSDVVLGNGPVVFHYKLSSTMAGGVAPEYRRSIIFDEAGVRAALANPALLDAEGCLTCSVTLVNIPRGTYYCTSSSTMNMRNSVNVTLDATVATLAHTFVTPVLHVRSTYCSAASSVHVISGRKLTVLTAQWHGGVLNSYDDSAIDFSLMEVWAAYNDGTSRQLARGDYALYCAGQPLDQRPYDDGTANVEVRFTENGVTQSAYVQLEFKF